MTIFLSELKELYGRKQFILLSAVLLKQADKTET